MDDRRASAPAENRPRPLAPKTLLGLQIAVAVILIGWALHATASVSALLAAALFVAIVLSPLDALIRERTGQAWLGHLVSLVVMLVVLLTFAAGLLFAAQRLAAEFPGLGQLSTDQIPGMGSEGQDAQARDGASELDADADGAADGGPGGLLSGFELSSTALASRLADLTGTVALTGLQFATAGFGGVVLVVFLALIMLVDAPKWHRRILGAMGEDRRDETLRSAAVVGRMVSRFVVVRAVMGLVTALLYMSWLWVFGVDLILVWGVLTLILSFIPNLGSVLSGILPTIYAFLTKDFGTAILVGVGLTAIEQVIGNFVDPRVQGQQISISPTVILSGLLVFTWIWGVPGALLSTPMLIAAVVIFARIGSLRPVALLLSDCADYDALDEMVRA